MIIAVDVDYKDAEVNGNVVTTATAAALLFQDWSSTAIIATDSVQVAGVAPYQPGAFFERELPCIQHALRVIGCLPNLTILIDGYVWLGDGVPGLGAKLYEAMGGQVNRLTVVGVAKTKYGPATTAIPVLRGHSKKPLWVTAVGELSDAMAAEHVASMHGGHRLPTMLKAVDSLCRGRSPYLV